MTLSAASGDARETLRRGTRYLDTLTAYAPLAGPWPDGAEGVARGRFVGNCLAELDRFLHVLMDTVAPTLGVIATPDQHNAVNKIGRLAAPSPSLAADQARLRALGRSRACFRRCQGLVRRPDVTGGAWMTSGWSAPDTIVLRRFRIGEQLVATGADLAQVGAFYDDLADRLVADQRRRAPG